MHDFSESCMGSLEREKETIGRGRDDLKVRVVHWPLNWDLD